MIDRMHGRQPVLRKPPPARTMREATNSSSRRRAAANSRREATEPVPHLPNMGHRQSARPRPQQVSPACHDSLFTCLTTVRTTMSPVKQNPTEIRTLFRHTDKRLPDMRLPASHRFAFSAFSSWPSCSSWWNTVCRRRRHWIEPNRKCCREIKEEVEGPAGPLCHRL
jgi:hypothetical protein